MESALGIPAGNLAATLDRYNKYRGRRRGSRLPQTAGIPLPPQANGPWAAFDLSLGRAMYSGFTLGGLAVTSTARCCVTTAASSPACMPSARARPTSPRTAKVTPAARSWAKARSSGAAPAHTPQVASRRARLLLDGPSRHWPPPSSFRCLSWYCATVGRWLTLTHDAIRQFVPHQLIQRISSPGSSADVASSRNTAFGLFNRIRANATRCCSPGESTLAQSWLFVETIDQRCQRNLDKCPLNLVVRRYRRAQRDTKPPPAGRPSGTYGSCDKNIVSLSPCWGSASCPTRTATIAPGCAAALSCRCPTAR